MCNILLLPLHRIINSLLAVAEQKEHPVHPSWGSKTHIQNFLLPPIFHHLLFKLPLQSIIGSLKEWKKTNSADITHSCLFFHLSRSHGIFPSSLSCAKAPAATSPYRRNTQHSQSPGQLLQPCSESLQMIMELQGIICMVWGHFQGMPTPDFTATSPLPPSERRLPVCAKSATSFRQTDQDLSSKKKSAKLPGFMEQEKGDLLV